MNSNRHFWWMLLSTSKKKQCQNWLMHWNPKIQVIFWLILTESLQFSTNLGSTWDTSVLSSANKAWNRTYRSGFVLLEWFWCDVWNTFFAWFSEVQTHFTLQQWRATSSTVFSVRKALSINFQLFRKWLRKECRQTSQSVRKRRRIKNNKKKLR